MSSAEEHQRLLQLTQTGDVEAAERLLASAERHADIDALKAAWLCLIPKYPSIEECERFFAFWDRWSHDAFSLEPVLEVVMQHVEEWAYQSDLEPNWAPFLAGERPDLRVLMYHSLRLDDAFAQGDAFERLMQSPIVLGFVSLYVLCETGPREAELIAHSPYTHRLITLSMEGDDKGMGDAGIQALAGANFPHLLEVELINHRFTDAGAEAIAHANWPTLDSLDLGGLHDFTARGVAAIARSETLTSLSTLGFSGVPMGNAVAEVLVQSHRPFKSLYMGYCNINDQGAEMLANAEVLKASLNMLWLDGNHITALGQRRLKEAYGKRVSLGDQQQAYDWDYE